MSDVVIENVLNGKLDVKDLVAWLDNGSNNTSEENTLFSCSKSEFVVYFLTYLRSQTDKIIQTNVNALQVLQHQNTPEKIFHSQRKHRRSISEPKSSDQDGKPMDTLTINGKSNMPHGSPNKDRSCQKSRTKRIKTKLFVDTEPLHKSRSHEYDLNHSASFAKTDSDDSKLISGVDSFITSSTSMHNKMKALQFPELSMSSPVTPIKSTSVSRHGSYNHLPTEHHERCDTPSLCHKSKFSSNEKPNSLGNYFVNGQTSKSNRKKKSSNRNHSCESISDTSKSFDSSKSDVVIDTAKGYSSSKKDKHHIKPRIFVNSYMRSTSLNSFNVDQFQQQSISPFESTVAFNQTNDLETEHNMLEQGELKLSEKFNMCSVNSPPMSASTPQAKLKNRNSSNKHCIQADVNKITFKEKIDMLVDIYESIMKNNLVLNISSEIYFLLSILLSKQYERDYLCIEAEMDNKVYLYLLRSIHNSSYFAVKTLWRERYVLELMFDKASLKLIGENKQVRSFFPELAKFLLNLYGLKCEAETLSKDNKTDLSVNKFTSNIVCFNFETDNMDNFPSIQSFQNFKKQRDLFYEILRWWAEPENQTSSNRISLRSRIKSLLSLAIAPANHAHLARLIRDHIIVECQNNTQESRLNKLQRRLVGSSSATAADSYLLPKFNDREQFYRDLIIFAENESFRVHLRDAIVSELLNLDATVTLLDLRNHAGSTSTNFSAGYLHVVKKLCVLSKFLGFLISLPYTQVPVDYALKTVLPSGGETLQIIPKEKILENDLQVRNYIQPPFNIIDILLSAHANHRLSLTIPWLVHYIAMLDYEMLRTRYYSKLLKIIFKIYRHSLKDVHCALDNSNNESALNTMKRNNVIFLKLCLGWLFEMPHFPHELYYEIDYSCVENNGTIETTKEISIDFLNLVDEKVIFNICGYLKELNVLLLSSRSSLNQKVSTFRHITPFTMSSKFTGRYKNREKRIQSHLEEELIKSQPTSIRRVLEMVIDRVTSATIKELSTSLNESKARARTEVLLAIKQKYEQCILVTTVENIYESELKTLKSRAMEIAHTSVNTRTTMALQGLLAVNIAKTSLEAVAKRSSFAKITKWIEDNWSSTSIFCKSLEKELHELMNADNLQTPQLPEVQFEEQVLVSPSATIIKLKEYTSVLLNYEPSEIQDVFSILEDARLCCISKNLFVNPTTTIAIHQLTCEMVVTCISRQPDHMTATLLQKVELIWNACCPDREINKSVTETSLEERDFGEEDCTPTTDVNKTQQAQTITNPLLKYYERTLCPRNIILLSSSKHPQTSVWQKMADYIVFLLKNYYLSEDSLTEQCLAVYRQDWSQSILENLSQCMRSVSSQWGRSSAGKFTLFLDFLAEYCDDMDYE